MNKKQLQDRDLFRGNVCHQIVANPLNFIKNTIISNDIIKYWNQHDYFKAFYLLACVDYLSKLNNIPLYSKYDEIRLYKLEECYYPQSARLRAKISNISIEDCCPNPNPEFLKYNIMEGDLFDVK